MADALKGRKISELLLTFVLSFVIGTFALLAYIIRLVKHGPAKWLHVKKRNKRPEILDSDQYGTHHWMPLKVSRLKLGVWDGMTIVISTCPVKALLVKDINII